MTITSSGPVCDICEKYILLEPMQNFKIQGIDSMLQCHDGCKPILVESMDKKDWKILPNGPLYRAFEDNYKEQPK